MVLLSGCAGPDPEPVDPNLLIEGVYWNIVTDIPFPANVADRDVVATFTLQQSSLDHKGGLVAALDPLPAEPRTNLDGTHVEWVVERVGDPAVDPSEGETLAYHFARAGAYLVRARIVDDDSGLVVVSTEGAAPTLWQRDFRVSPTPGPGQTVTLGTFPVESSHAEGRLLIGPELLGEPNPDPGRVELVKPDGTLSGDDGTRNPFNFSPADVGEWTLRWNTGKATFADGALVILRVEYEYVHETDPEDE